MQRRGRLGHGWIALALLAFGFRALVPVGYMYATVAGETRLVICPAGLSPAAAHHMPGMAHAGHAKIAADQCPFALAAGAGLLAATQQAAEPYFVVLTPAPAQALASVPSAPPCRYRAPRGPPTLS